MRILAIADVHGRAKFIDYLARRVSSEDYELVVVAGDLTYFGELPEAAQILRSLSRKLNRRVLFVPGNCDDPELLEVDGVNSEALNLHGRLLAQGELRFYGIGGSNYTPFNTPIEWSEEQIRRFLEPVEGVEWNKLVLVTHVPVYSVMDNINGENRGSRALFEFLERHGALLLITGHFHEYSGYVKVSRTIVLNPGPFINGYYALVNLRGGGVEARVGNFLE